MKMPPRKIHPSLLDYGDEITVKLPIHGGIVTSLTGRVRNKTRSGKTNYWRTTEGSILVAWESSGPTPDVTLLDREPLPQTRLELFANV